MPNRPIIRIPLQNGGAGARVGADVEWEDHGDSQNVGKAYDYYRASSGAVKASLDKFIRFWDENHMQGFQGDMLRQIRSASRGPSEIEQIMERGLDGMSAGQMSEGRSLISAFKSAVRSAIPDWLRSEGSGDVQKAERITDEDLVNVQQKVTDERRKIQDLRNLASDVDSAFGKLQSALGTRDVQRAKSAQKELEKALSNLSNKWNSTDSRIIVRWVFDNLE